MIQRKSSCSSWCSCLPRSDESRPISRGAADGAMDGSQKAAAAAAVTVSTLVAVQSLWRRWGRRQGQGITQPRDTLDGITRFLESPYSGMRNTIRLLVSLAGPANGCVAHYYALPKKPGTLKQVEIYNEISEGGDESSQVDIVKAEHLTLVASTNSQRSFGSAPPPGLHAVLNAALRGTGPVSEGVNVFVGVVEHAEEAAPAGVLVFEGSASSPSAENLNLRSAAIAWASVLGGRLERLRQKSLLLQNQQIANLHTLGGDIAQQNSISGLMDVAHEPMAAAMNVEKITLWFLDESRDEIWTPKKEDLPNGIKLPFGVGLVGHVAKRARETGNFAQSLICTNHPRSCPYWQGDPEPTFTTQSLLCVPILASNDQRLLGLIQILNKLSKAQLEDDDGFTDTDIRLSRVMAEILGAELERLLIAKIAAKVQLDVDGRDKRGSGISLFTEFYEEAALLMKKKTSSLDRRASDTFDMINADTEQPVDVDVWELDYWQLPEKSHFALFMRALSQTDASELANISESQFQRFFSKVKNGYNDNPYHNFHHGMSTLHYACKLAQVSGTVESINKFCMFSLLVGSLCHDLDHRGKNTQFEVATRSELALRYNDCSPLENHHCARTFEIAFSEGPGGPSNIFVNMSAEDYSAVRKVMVACILATDMKHHGDHVKQAQKFDLLDDAEGKSQELCELFMHVADVANPFMPTKIALKWNEALCEEFTLQVQAEREHGLPVTPFMDGLTNPLAKARSGLGFSDFVLFPLMDPLFRIFPSWEDPKRWMGENRQHHANVIEELQKKEEEAG